MCDGLRGGMHASQYMDYVLPRLFIKYIGGKYAGVPYAPIANPKGASFKDLAALKATPGIEACAQALAGERRTGGGDVKGIEPSAYWRGVPPSLNLDQLACCHAR